MRFGSLLNWRANGFSKAGRKSKGAKRAGELSRRGFRVRSIESLESRQMLSINLGQLHDIQVPGGKSVLVPLNGLDSNSEPITYTFSATDSNVQLSLVSTASKSLVLNVSGTDNTNTAFTGTLIIHLFEDLAPQTTARIEQLVTNHYYDGLSIFRILDGFVAQSGKTNNGNDTGVLLNDEFNTSLTFTSPGLIAMANRGRDTADSEYFITAIDNAGATTPITLANDPQFLDFRYTIFGQLVSGFDTFEKVMSTTVTSNGSENSQPTHAITVTSASLINDTQDAVLRVFAPASFDGNSALVTVTATNTDNVSTQQLFTASAVTDTETEPPFLGPVAANFNVATGQTLNFPLTSTDFSGGGVDYEIAETDSSQLASVNVNHTTGAVTVVPNSGFVGTINVIVGVRAVSASNTLANFDTQQFTVTVLAPTLAPVVDQTTAVGVADLLTLNTTDPIGDDLVYKIVDANTLAAPDHVAVSIDSTGHVTLTPDAGFSGTVNLKAEVRSVDSPDVQANYVVTQAFALNVVAPTLNAVENQLTDLGQPLSITLSGNNSAGGGVVYAIRDPNTFAAPAHVTISINQATGVATITPDVGFTGSVPLVAAVRAAGSDDVQLNYTTDGFTLLVVAPSLTRVLSTQTTAVGVPVSFGIGGIDPSGGGLIYKIVDANTLAAPSSKISILIDSSGHATIKPNAGFSTRDFLNLIAEVRAVGSDDVQANYTQSQAFTFAVLAPTLAAVPNQTVGVGVPIDLNLNATNPGGGSLFYSLRSGDTSNINVQVNPDTGAVVITPHAGFHGTAGYTVGVRAAASDDVAANYTTRSFSVTTVGATLGSITPSDTTAEGVTKSFTVTSSDPAGGGVVYAVRDAGTFGTPANATVSVDQAGNVIVTPHNGFIGNINLLIGVREAGSDDVEANYDTAAYTLTVVGPTLDSVSTQTTGLGVPLTVDLAGHNALGNSLVYKSFSTLSDVDVVVNSSTGVATLTPHAGKTGPFSIQVGVRDSTSPDDPANYVKQTFTLNVDAPTLAAIGNQVTELNTAINIPLLATDPANQGLQYSIVDATTLAAPVGVAISINPTTHVATITPNSGFAGVLHLLARVQDTGSGSDPADFVTRAFTLTVDDVNLNSINNIQVPGGKSVLVPLTGVDAAGQPITYTFSSSNPNVQVSLVSPASKTLVLNVSGTDKNGNPFTGTLKLHLFEDLAPQTTARIEQLVTQGYYNGLSIFRVLDGFVAQTGNNGSGDTGQLLTDEFDPSLTFTSPGLLAMANRGRDTADAEIFITAIDNAGATTPITLTNMPQFLDFRYTIFGQLVSGFDTFEKVMTVPVGVNSQTGETSLPNNTITVTSASLIDDTQNAVLKVTAPASFDGNSATITVTGTNPTGQSSQKQFTAAVVTDTTIGTQQDPAHPTTSDIFDPPFLGSVGNQTTTAGTAANFALTSNDLSGHGVTYKVVDATTKAAPTNVSVSINQANGQVTLTPNAGFTGTVNLLAEARSNSAADTQTNYDTQAFTLTVNAATNTGGPAAPTGLAIDSSSNTGPFDGNGYISKDTPKLTVTAPTGSTVKFKLNGTVIATGTETSAGSGQFTATLPAGKLAVGSNAITAVASNTDGTSVDSTALTLIYAPNYVSGVYVVPGAPGSTQSVGIAWTHRNASYQDEIGYFIATSADGTVGGVAPGAAGYAHAALTSATRHVIFAKGQKAGASDTISLQGGQFIVFYMIQDDTTADFLAKNPNNVNHGNDNSAAPLAFFSVQAANPDGMKHTQIIADPVTGRVQYNWEDLMHQGDSDFNDVVMTVRLAAQSGNPPATVHAPGTGNTGVTLNGTLHGGHQGTAPGDIGVFFVDTPDGAIGTLTPGSAGYAAAALAANNFQVLFAAGSAAGVTKHITVPAGKYLAFFVISDGTTANFKTVNPNNSSDGSAVAMFSFDAANANGLNHFRWFTPGQTATNPANLELHIMDHLFGKESEFDDLTADLSFTASSSSSD